VRSVGQRLDTPDAGGTGDIMRHRDALVQCLDANFFLLMKLLYNHEGYQNLNLISFTLNFQAIPILLPTETYSEININIYCTCM